MPSQAWRNFEIAGVAGAIGGEKGGPSFLQRGTSYFRIKQGHAWTDWAREWKIG